MTADQPPSASPGRRTIVFVNGVVNDYADLRRWLHAGDHLICADGGLAHCAALHLVPHAIVGDLDSADPTLVAQMATQGVTIQRHPPEKDQTDLELAIEYALAGGASEIWLLGALGGRLDQTLANLLVLAQRDWPVPIHVAEGAQVAQIMDGGETLTLGGRQGSTVSILPLSAEVTGVTLSGLRYPLADASLTLGSTLGISNEIAQTPASIRIVAGKLLVVQTLNGADVEPREHA